MTSVVDLSEGEDGLRNPFEGERIEVSEREMRKVAFPAVILGRWKRRLNEFATAFAYGR